MATQAAVMTPADRAGAQLVRGAFDLHVHVAPDVPPRRIDDVSLARRFAESGLGGLRAQVALHLDRRARAGRLGRRPAVEVVGTLALNQAVGGMNPLAVEIAAREGARIVWMPTVDSPAETAGRTEPKPGDKVPQWARLQHELRELGLGVEPVHVTGDDGRAPAGDPRRAPRDRTARSGPRHRPPRPGRHVRRRRRRARGGRRARSSSRTRSSRARTSRSRTRSSSPARLPARALPDDAAQREDVVGARLRRRARRRRRAHAVLERPREPRLPARRGRARALGRPPARRRASTRTRCAR